MTAISSKAGTKPFVSLVFFFQRGQVMKVDHGKAPKSRNVCPISSCIKRKLTSSLIFRLLSYTFLLVLTVSILFEAVLLRNFI